MRHIGPLTTLALWLMTSTASFGDPELVFDPRHDLAVGAMPLGAAAGDLDGDGRIDLVFGAHEDHRLVVYSNRSVPADLSFGAIVMIGTGEHPQGIAVGDLDGDGRADVVTANSGGATMGGSISILRNTSSPGTLALAQGLFFEQNTAHRVAIADLDGDTRPDIAATSNSSKRIVFYRNLGPVGTLDFAVAGQLIEATFLQPLALADLDGNGLPEVIVPLPSGDALHIYPNLSSTGAFSFGAPLEFPMPTGPHGIVVSDFNADGKLDLAIASTAGVLSVFQNTSTGAGNVALGPRADYAAVPGAHSAAAGDLDGDGLDEVVVGTAATNVLAIFHNVTSAGGAIQLVLDQQLPVGPWPITTAIADIDGDGANDLVISNHAAFTGSIFRNSVAPVAPFLRLPVAAQCFGVPCTAHTAEVSAILDHSVPTGYNCHSQQACDGVVLAFNYEKGDQLSNCAPPGYSRVPATPFLEGVLNYVGSACRVSPSNMSPRQFLDYDGHSGYDFRYANVEIVAAADGVLEVPAVDPINNPNGSSPKATFNSLRITHSNGLETWYLHAVEGSECLPFQQHVCKAMSPARPQPGAAIPVTAGQTIGVVGRTGTGSPHLHFEVRRNGRVVDPYDWSLWQ